MIISTGDIRQDYTIIDVVFAYGAQKEGFLGINKEKAFLKVKEDLEKNAEAIGADAVIYATFDYRVAVDGKKQVLEFIANGTAVKL